MRSKKRRSYYFGLVAEYWVMLFLMLKGYRIVAHRLKTPVGEIDVLASTRQHLVVIEVKARKHHADAAASLSLHQQQRLKRGAEYIRAAKPTLAQRAIRFDCCTVTRYMQIKHITHAFM
jgi:putative endonuclease